MPAGGVLRRFRMIRVWRAWGWPCDCWICIIIYIYMYTHTHIYIYIFWIWLIFIDLRSTPVTVRLYEKLFADARPEDGHLRWADGSNFRFPSWQEAGDFLDALTPDSCKELSQMLGAAPFACDSWWYDVHGFVKGGFLKWWYPNSWMVFEGQSD